MTCTGTVGGMQNVCLMKVANPSGAGPFGGVIAFQMAPAAAAAPPAAVQVPNAATLNGAALDAALGAVNSLNTPAGEVANPAADSVNVKGSKA